MKRGIYQEQTPLLATRSDLIRISASTTAKVDTTDTLNRLQEIEQDHPDDEPIIDSNLKLVLILHWGMSADPYSQPRSQNLNTVTKTAPLVYK